MNNKKGISAIVATVLIILITVAAVTIIWAAIIPMINNQLEESQACLEAIQQITLENKGFTCVDNGLDGAPLGGDDIIKLQIGHGSDEFEIADMQIITVGSDGNSITEKMVGVWNSTSTGNPVLAADFPGVNEEKVFNIYSANKPASLSIAPIVGTGDGQMVCDVAATMTQFRECA